LGNPSPITVLSLAEEIIELTNSKSDIRFEKLPSDDPKDRCPEISKAKKHLGWTPKISRREGLQTTIQSITNFKDSALI
jgi:nucleoside-diphosphate-sugar epimerase